MYTDIHPPQSLFHDHNSCHLLYTCATSPRSGIVTVTHSPYQFLQIPVPAMGTEHLSSQDYGMEREGSPFSCPSQPWCHHPANLPISKQGTHCLPDWQRLHLAQDWAFWIEALITYLIKPPRTQVRRESPHLTTSGRMLSGPPTKASKSEKDPAPTGDASNTLHTLVLSSRGNWVSMDYRRNLGRRLLSQLP